MAYPNPACGVCTPIVTGRTRTRSSTGAGHRRYANQANPAVNASALFNTMPKVAGFITSSTSPNPFGSLDDVVRAPGGARVFGWLIDPDSTNATDTHVYVDAAGTSLGGTNVQRLDVRDLYPAYGDKRGYSAIRTKRARHTRRRNVAAVPERLTRRLRRATLVAVIGVALASAAPIWARAATDAPSTFRPLR